MENSYWARTLGVLSLSFSHSAAGTPQPAVEISHTSCTYNERTTNNASEPQARHLLFRLFSQSCNVDIYYPHLISKLSFYVPMEGFLWIRNLSSRIRFHYTLSERSVSCCKTELLNMNMTCSWQPYPGGIHMNRIAPYSLYKTHHIEKKNPFMVTLQIPTIHYIFMEGLILELDTKYSLIPLNYKVLKSFWHICSFKKYKYELPSGKVPLPFIYLRSVYADKSALNITYKNTKPINKTLRIVL